MEPNITREHAEKYVSDCEKNFQEWIATYTNALKEIVKRHDHFIPTSMHPIAVYAAPDIRKQAAQVCYKQIQPSFRYVQPYPDLHFRLIFVQENWRTFTYDDTNLAIILPIVE